MKAEKKHYKCFACDWMCQRITTGLPKPCPKCKGAVVEFKKAVKVKTHMQVVCECGWLGRRKYVNALDKPCSDCGAEVAEFIPTEYLAKKCKEAGYPDPTFEHVFHAERKWRFDLCWPELKISLEIQGGAFSGGRHTQGVGYENDREKSFTAQMDGWIAIEVTTNQIAKGKAMEWLGKTMELRRREGKEWIAVPDTSEMGCQDCDCRDDVTHCIGDGAAEEATGKNCCLDSVIYKRVGKK